MASSTQVRRAALLGLAGALLGGAMLLCLGPPRAREVPERQKSAASDAPAPGPAGAVIVTGRCVDARTLVPIAGCEVRWLVWPQPDPWARKAVEQLWSEPVHSGNDGRFRLVTFPMPAHDCGVVVRAGDRVSLYRTVTASAGTEQDLGDLALKRGTRVHGRVVDTAGAPRAGVELEFERNEGGFLSTKCTSAADGTFRSEFCFPPGTWTIDTRHSAALRSPLACEVDEDVAQLDIAVVVFADGEVPLHEGAVLDQDDQPVPGAEVLRGVVTDAAGRFRHACGPASDSGREGYVSYHPDAPGCHADPPRQEVPVGARDIVLRVRRARSSLLEVTLLDPISGQRRDDFDVVGAIREPDFGWGARLGWDGKARSFGPHADGRARLEGLGPGEYLVAVRPSGDRSFLVQAALVTVPTDSSALAFTLPEPATRVLEVVAADGSAVAGSCVELLLPLDDGDLSLHGRSDPREVASFRDWWPSIQGPHALLVSSTRTDATGRAELRGPAERELCVRVAGGTHLVEVCRDVLLPGPPLRLLVRPGATVVGRLPSALREGLGDGKDDGGRSVGSTPDWVDAIGAVRNATGLVLEQMQGHPIGWRRMPPGSYVFPIRPDGLFHIGGVESGTWKVKLESPGTLHSVVLGVAAIGQQGATFPLDFDAEALTPATVTATVLADGRPWAHRIVGIQAVDQGRTANCVGEIACGTDAHGRFTARLLPGRWRVAVAAQGIPMRFPQHPDRITLPAEVEVRAGADVAVELAFSRRRLTVRVVDGSGRPRPFFRLHATVGHDDIAVLTDHEGRFVVDPLLGDAIEFETRVFQRSPGGRSWSSSSAPAGFLRVPAQPRDPVMTHIVD